MKELVSIVISNFNKEKYIRNSINSVLNQTYKNIEIIITDDGSTDGSNKIIQELASTDKRIKYFQKPHIGKIKAYNYGMTKVTGRYVKLFSSDDILIKSAILQLVKNINGYDVVAYNWDLADDKLNIIEKNILNMEQCSKQNITIYDVIKGESFPSGNYFMKKEVINKIFPIPEESSYEDWYIYMMLIKNNFKVLNYDKSLAIYVQTPNSAYGGVYDNSYKIIKYRAKREIKMLNIFKNILPNQYEFIINYRLKELELLVKGNFIEIIKSKLKLEKKIKMTLKIYFNFLYRTLVFFKRKIKYKSNKNIY